MEILKEIQNKIKPVDREINFEIGDTVKVHYRIVEGNKERIQVYEGIVIAIDNKGMSKTFTVRKLSFDVGVERIFPFYTTRIAKIDVIRKGKSRRSKLYYLRERTGKSAKLREKNVKGSKKHSVTVADVPGTAAEPAAAETTPQQES
ncbi:MAG TPA: 50S ribosomal protein L19 [Spirochaetota bacterium]|nr:50S ribosomal protein L19 [Spirochaetota bacterium]HOD15425.1 50S ribosomal protein L19 [Spirochaetota bacterium]HPG50239.1 50S ribosomal protein L19 [Spirochaetota bacterium]HPN12774.1 50S ribosomal protein L19 [Spirochaetota bacterium]HQL81854.1 50S ribosomal protein L19 [Spirochaetota bacterium]